MSSTDIPTARGNDVLPIVDDESGYLFCRETRLSAFESPPRAIQLVKVSNRIEMFDLPSMTIDQREMWKDRIGW